MNVDNLLIPAVMLFALGFLAQAIKFDLKFPPDLAKALSNHLLIGIGLSDFAGQACRQAQRGSDRRALRIG